MAVTASISLSPSTVQINQTSRATLTVSNSGGSAVSVIAATPSCVLTGHSAATDKTPFAASVIPLSAGFPTTVPAGGSLKLYFDICVFEPSGTTTFDVGALVLSSGNVYSSPTPATLTVEQLDFQDAT